MSTQPWLPDAHEPRLPRSPCGVAGPSEALLHGAQDVQCKFNHADLGECPQANEPGPKGAEPGSLPPGRKPGPLPAGTHPRRGPVSAVASTGSKGVSEPIPSVRRRGYRSGVSFGIYFVPHQADGDWDAAMDALEEVAGREVPFGDDDDALWERIKAAVQAELPGWQESSGGWFRELDYDPMGMQLMMSVGEVSLSVPYWTAGDEAVRTVDTLRRIVSVVEGVTGLVAYDPQSGGLFLKADPGVATATFDQIRSQFVERYLADPPPAPAKRRWPLFRKS